MSGREPAWFEPEPFCRQVLNFGFRKLGVIPDGTKDHLKYYPKEFREAVEIVGRGVFTLQLITRDKLRSLFIDCIDLVAWWNDGLYGEICEFMAQGILHNDIFQATLTCFAIVAELTIFLNDFRHPIPYYWHPMPWCAIYDRRLRKKLEFNGGWEMLLERTKTRYIERGLYKETFLSFLNNNPIPHAERPDRLNWPENPLEFLHDRFREIPASTTLAMGMIQAIYDHEVNLIPVPGAGASAVRLMHRLDEMEEDGWC